MCELLCMLHSKLCILALPIGKKCIPFFRNETRFWNVALMFIYYLMDNSYITECNSDVLRSRMLIQLTWTHYVCKQYPINANCFLLLYLNLVLTRRLLSGFFPCGIVFYVKNFVLLLLIIFLAVSMYIFNYDVSYYYFL